MSKGSVGCGIPFVEAVSTVGLARRNRVRELGQALPLFLHSLRTRELRVPFPDTSLRAAFKPGRPSTASGPTLTLQPSEAINVV